MVRLKLFVNKKLLKFKCIFNVFIMCQGHKLDNEEDYNCRMYGKWF